ncbi:MAG: hypothetical protein NT027_02790, partial [Proteobacteria bacterium]|nr:hypothetical protein [Pseudomonadota bacterium]
YGILHGGYRVETGQFQNAFKARFASKDGFVPNLERRKSLESAIGELLRSHSCVDWEGASKYIAQSIPYSHFEMRGQLLRRSAEWSTKYKASKIYSAIAWMSDSFFVGLAALQSEINNAKLIGIQHGGYYGYAKVHSHVFNTEYQFLDEFVSWGWDGRETVFGNISAKIIPFGSIHLRNISKGSNVNSHLGRPKNLPILFVVGPFNRIAFKCEFYFSYETFLKEVFPNNALALSRVAVSTKKDIHVKGSGDIFTDSNYISIVEKHCQIASVKTETLNFNLRAFDLFHNYSIVCFDTLGTGFFEAIRAGVVAFLLPSAQISPVMESTVKPSELFFLDPNTDLD